MTTSKDEQTKKFGFLKAEALVRKLSGGGYIFIGADDQEFACVDLTMVAKSFEESLQMFFENNDRCEVIMILKRPDLEKSAMEEIKKKLF